jgi:GR25 family glycosyltransferase involved in LPS biosynthesis
MSNFSGRMPELAVFVTHYTPLSERRAFLVDQFGKHGIENAVFIEEADREALTRDTVNKFYRPDKKVWRRKAAILRPILLQEQQWSAEKKSWSEGVYEDNTFQVPFQDLRPSEISLAIKHFIALENAARCGSPQIMIFEDDVVLADNFTDEFMRCFAETPPDWDVIFPGAPHRLRPPEWNGIQRCFRKDPQRGKYSDSYIVTPRAARRMLADLRPFTMPIDFELTVIMNKLDLNCYWWEPGIVRQGSQIGLFPSAVNPLPEQHDLLVEERLVRLLYLAVLQRAPDAAGFTHYVARLRQDPSLRMATDLIDEFYHSEERAKRRSRP